MMILTCTGPSARPSLTGIFVLCTTAALMGCADDPTAIRVKLVVDPTINSEAQVLAVTSHIQLVLDAPTGFTNLPGGEGRAGSMVARNTDLDKDLELVLDEAVVDRTSFPQLRLRPGSNLDRRFRITALGLVGKEVAAVGGAAWVAFTPGESTEISVPLNLRPRYRPPRVVLTFPNNGEKSVPRALGALHVEFSKWISAASIKGNLRLVFTSTAKAQAVPGVWTLHNTSVVELGYPEERTRATFTVGKECHLSSGDFRIEATTGVTDTSGRALDQDALQAGTGYTASFSVPGTAATSPCSGTTALPCKDDKDCNPGCGSSSQSCPNPKFTCDMTTGSPTMGQCLPADKSCSGLVCPPGTVCDPGDDPTVPPGSGNTATCLPDCRNAGETCGASRACDLSTGLCKACQSTGSSGACYLPCGNASGANVKCPTGYYCDTTSWLCKPCNPGQTNCSQS